MRYCATWVLVFASVLPIESIAYARTTSPVRAWIEDSVDETGVDIVVIDPAPARGVSYPDRDPAEAAFGSARIHLCHISHHPRDGLRPEEHACPLFIAGRPAVRSAADPEGGALVTARPGLSQSGILSTG
jgi:hypothetical protein